MILLTGGGTFATAFSRQLACDIISIRTLSSSELEELISRYEVVIHNSANLRCTTFEEAIKDNFDLTRQVLDTIARVKPGIRFIYLSSMSILRDENSYAAIEDMSLYAFSKYLGEIYCLRHPLDSLSCIRFSTLFCKDPLKDGLSGLLADAVYKKEITLLNNGESKRDFIPIDVAVQYVIKLLSTEMKYDRKYNIVSGKGFSFYELAQIASRHIPFLRINEKNVIANKPVLHDFSTVSLDKLGRIEFSLEEHVLEFIKHLQPNASIDI